MFNYLWRHVQNKYNIHKTKIVFYLNFIVLCLIAGTGSAFFSIMTDYAYLWGMELFKIYQYWSLLYIPFFFVIIALALKRYFPYAGGSGLPQGYAVDVFDNESLQHTYSLKTMFGKLTLTFLSIFSGASLGREGPTIQICASIFASMKNISHKQKKFLIHIGSGIGVATAFNAPLGGITFALEEYIKHSETKANLILLLGVAIAGWTSIIFTGNYSYMGFINTNLLLYNTHIFVIAISSGVICGILGSVFTYIVVAISVKGKFPLYNIKFKHYLVFAFIFGFLVALTGIISHGLSFGNGVIFVKEQINNSIPIPWYYSLYKTLGAIFSIGAGMPGGYFSTALSIGAGITAPLHSIFPNIAVEQLYLLGMVGFLSAITQAPITAVAMILSITSNTQFFILPVIFTSFLSSYIARFFGDSVYHQQVLSYIDKDRYNETR